MSVFVFTDKRLAEYNFGEDHPFGPRRFHAFCDSLIRSDGILQVGESRLASSSELEWFHTKEYLKRVRKASESGGVYLDRGDTPAFAGVFEAASRVVGTVLLAIEKIQTSPCRRAFVPIAGMHHGYRDHAAGFCVFNDCCVAVEMLRRVYGLQRIVYVDIDAHHGDGVYYSFEADPDLFIVDFHEDGRFLYPGTGTKNETGRGPAAGTKMNVPMPIGADDELFLEFWRKAEEFLERVSPQFVLFQCGADSLDGDDLAHLCYSPRTHRFVAERLCRYADRCCEGKLLALGGGGYNLENIAQGWNAVVAAMAETL